MPDVVVTFLMLWFTQSVMGCLVAAISEPRPKERIILMVKVVVFLFIFLLFFFGWIYLECRQYGVVFWH